MSSTMNGRRFWRAEHALKKKAWSVGGAADSCREVWYRAISVQTWEMSVSA
jgi:hypothetical protein